MKAFQKTMMKIVIRGILFKQMLNFLKIYMICILIYHSYQKEIKLINEINLYTNCGIKKLRCPHKILKTSIRSRTNIKESAQSNPV